MASIPALARSPVEAVYCRRRRVYLGRTAGGDWHHRRAHLHPGPDGVQGAGECASGGEPGDCYADHGGVRGVSWGFLRVSGANSELRGVCGADYESQSDHASGSQWGMRSSCTTELPIPSPRSTTVPAKTSRSASRWRKTWCSAWMGGLFPQSAERRRQPHLL